MRAINDALYVMKDQKTTDKKRSVKKIPLRKHFRCFWSFMTRPQCSFIYKLQNQNYYDIKLPKIPIFYWPYRVKGPRLDRIKISTKIGPIKLYNAYFYRSVLEGVDLQKATLFFCDFINAHITDCHFEQAMIRNSHFEQTEIVVSHFEQAKIWLSHFEQAVISKSNFYSAVLYFRSFPQTFVGCNIYDATGMSDENRKKLKELGSVGIPNKEWERYQNANYPPQDKWEQAKDLGLDWSACQRYDYSEEWLEKWRVAKDLGMDSDDWIEWQSNDYSDEWLEEWKKKRALGTL